MSFVRFLILLAIFILVLSFFGISIRAIVQSPTGHDNLTFVSQLIRTGWLILKDWFTAMLAIFRGLIPHSVN